VPRQGQTEPNTEHVSEPLTEPKGGWSWTNKYMGQLFEARMQHSPFDVVAWHGGLFVCDAHCRPLYACTAALEACVSCWLIVLNLSVLAVACELIVRTLRY
jgi:homogentisate 1,2-dioxygenase